MSLLPASRRCVAILLVAGACARTDDAPARDSTAVVPPLAPPAVWRVSERSVGPLRIGMSLSEVEAALGARVPGADSVAECTSVRPPRGPAGVSMMLVKGRVARVDVDSAAIATVAGARVGDTETAVQRFYAGRTSVSPHKYTDGHYLTVTPAGAADSSYRIIFETDGQRVTRYRAGRLPEVAWVEGCS